ncbi:myrosinase 1-like [Diabrotica undecimpunctata]|uniref:myrosinase 1-like n=1 Tax=Diabrotica undecimpunctata TaxID=50387 RepID=UPI003B636C2B
MKFVLCFILCIISTSYTSDIVINNKRFPTSFLFGAATSSYQIEGGWDADGKGQNIWDNVTHKNPNFIKDGTNADVSSDSYHRYKDDVQLLKDHGAQFYRFSIAWPRIMPNGFRNSLNQAGVQYYKNLIAELKNNNIEPMITIYHNDLPQALQDLGGIKMPQFADWFAEYARVCFELFGNDVKHWMTINEPYVACTVGFISLPYEDGVEDYICIKNMLLAHANAWHIYDKDFRPTQGGKVGMVLNSNWFEPESDKPEDLEASERSMQFIWGWLAHPLYKGDYPEIMKTRVAMRSQLEGYNQSRLTELTSEEIAYIKGTNDFFCVNSYTTAIVRGQPEPPIGKPSHNTDLGVVMYQPADWQDSPLDWLKVCPWGIQKLLRWIANEYGNPEMIITENGYADGTGTLNDTIRYNYIKDYLSYIRDAMDKDGANVIGYGYWSLIDNFEWTSGYTAKFGLAYIDFNDPERKRIRKMSSYYYEHVIKTRCLLEDNSCQD